jgi:CP family cyanate transporter-like MFS transporter
MLLRHEARMKRMDPALVVVLAGVSAALHVGKLPPALPVLRDALDLTLVQAGFLLSLVQLAGMSLGLAAGLAADRIGLRRSMLCGLLVLGLASVAGAWARDAASLFALRALEGLGFLLASMPAPALIRRLVAPQRVSAMLGLWGAYMPLGAALALLCGPPFIAAASWPAWWVLMGALSLGMAVWVMAVVPADATAAPVHVGSWTQRLQRTLSTRATWLVAVSFALYSGQWLAVIGFLPSIYAQAGLASSVTAILTALAAAVNIVGNVTAGRLLQRGVAPQVLLFAGFTAMACGAAVAFAPWGGGPVLRYGAIVLFSMFGGMIPSTLFSLAVRFAPGDDTVAATVGWVQQLSSLGQFAGPPLVAWVASAAGGWHWTWAVTGGCCAAGLVLARAIAALARAQGHG